MCFYFDRNKIKGDERKCALMVISWMLMCYVTYVYLLGQREKHFFVVVVIVWSPTPMKCAVVQMSIMIEANDSYMCSMMVIYLVPRIYCDFGLETKNSEQPEK